jgi:hypothetical protein
MQNRVLLAALRGALREKGLVPLTHRQVPANDGGLALGQGVIAALAILRRDRVGHMSLSSAEQSLHGGFRFKGDLS